MSDSEAAESDLLAWALYVDGRVEATVTAITPVAGLAIRREAIRYRLLCGGVTATVLEGALAQAAEWREDIRN